VPKDGGDGQARDFPYFSPGSGKSPSYIWYVSKIVKLGLRICDAGPWEKLQARRCKDALSNITSSGEPLLMRSAGHA